MAGKFSMFGSREIASRGVRAKLIRDWVEAVVLFADAVYLADSEDEFMMAAINLGVCATVVKDWRRANMAWDLLGRPVSADWAAPTRIRLGAVMVDGLEGRPGVLSVSSIGYAEAESPEGRRIVHDLVPRQVDGVLSFEVLLVDSL